MKILFLHWGKSGAGPELLHEVFEAGLRAQVLVFASANLMSERRKLFDATNNVHFVKTYSSRLTFVLNSFRVITNGLSLRKFIVSEGITHVFSIMESPYQSLALPIWKGREVWYGSIIHDAEHHEGERGLIPRVTRSLEYIFADVVIGLSDAQSNLLRQLTKKPVVRMQLPITGQKSPLPLVVKPKNSLVKILFFGRLQAYKGIEELLHAVSILKEAGIENFQVEIVGQGPVSCLASSRLGNLVRWNVGWVPDDQITNILSDADVVVLPYQNGSQSGVVTICQKLHIPMVITPVSGLIEQVEKSGGALVCEDKSSQGIAKALQAVVEDRNILETLRNELARSHQSLYWAEDWAADLTALATFLQEN